MQSFPRTWQVPHLHPTGENVSTSLVKEGAFISISGFSPAELGGCSVAPSVKIINKSKRMPPTPPQGAPPECASLSFPDVSF